MPVGTAATVRGSAADQIKPPPRTQMVLAQHLSACTSKPGEAVVANRRTCNRFMGWPGPCSPTRAVQVFSLGRSIGIDDHGVCLPLPRERRSITLTPERSMEIQMALGADVVMAFDQCPPYGASEAKWRGLPAQPRTGWKRCAVVQQPSTGPVFGIGPGRSLSPSCGTKSARPWRHGPAGHRESAGSASVKPVGRRCTESFARSPVAAWTQTSLLMGKLSAALCAKWRSPWPRGSPGFDCVLPTPIWGRHGTRLKSGANAWNLRKCPAFRQRHTPLGCQLPLPGLQEHSRAYLQPL